MRTLLEQVNAGWHGRCAFVGYAFDRRKVESILRSGTRVCAEAHGPVGPRFWEKELPQLRALQLRVGACSGIKVVLRVREPFAWYVSWYLWEAALGGRQKINASSLPGNLQARILASGYTSTRHLSGQRGPLSPGESARAPRDVMLQRRISFFKALSLPASRRASSLRCALPTWWRRRSASASSPCSRQCLWVAGSARRTTRQTGRTRGSPETGRGAAALVPGIETPSSATRSTHAPRFPEIPRDSQRFPEINRD